VKFAFLFFLLITHWCGAPASWAARHTTVCLDIFLIVKTQNLSIKTMSLNQLVVIEYVSVLIGEYHLNHLVKEYH